MIARALKIDAVEFRRKNLLREGRPHPTGTVLKDAAIEKVLDRLTERMNWKQPFDRGTGVVRRGRGLDGGRIPVVASDAGAFAAAETALHRNVHQKSLRQAEYSLYSFAIGGAHAFCEWAHALPLLRAVRARLRDGF
jgi:CO/xanthine dehydrogenase Mo-binding subunit